MTVFFHCLVPVLPQECMNLHSDMPNDLLFVYYSLVRLNLVSGPNPHMNVNSGVASPNPFRRRGRGRVFFLNELSNIEVIFALKAPSYRVAKDLERGGGVGVWYVFFR